MAQYYMADPPMRRKTHKCIQFKCCIHTHVAEVASFERLPTTPHTNGMLTSLVSPAPTSP